MEDIFTQQTQLRDIQESLSLIPFIRPEESNHRSFSLLFMQ